MRHLDLALLRSFVAVAETGSVTRAAERVHLTQAAVSQQLKRLEDGLGAELFDRDRRRLRLSEAGERLLAGARRLLALNDELWSMMTAPDFTGEVRLGVPHDIAAPLLPQVLRGFRKDWPRVRVDLMCTTTPRLKGAHERGEIDLTLTTELGVPEGAERLFPDPLVWVGAPGGDAWQREPLPVAIGDQTCAFRGSVLAALGRAGRDWRITAESAEMSAVYASVEADLSISALLLSTVPPSLRPIPPEAGLPQLPCFNVNLHPPLPGATAAALELARHLRQGLGAAARRPAVAEAA